MNPFPGALSYWTSSNGVKTEVANFPEGDPWWENDADGDSLSNADEALYGSDPHAFDSDRDGLSDLVERDYSDPTAPFDPWSFDSNGNGYSDHDEYYQGLGYPLVVNYNSLSSAGTPFFSYADADGDGVKNPEDSDPLNNDRDGDGWVNWEDGWAYFDGVGGYYMDDSTNGVWTDPGVYIGGNWYPSGTVDSDYDGTPDHLDPFPYGSYDYQGTEYGGSWQDSDTDGIPDDQDPWPYDDTNGAGSMSDSDGDGYYDGADSHPGDSTLWDDYDYDGRNGADDSHPGYSWLWSDWDGNSNNSTLSFDLNFFIRP